VNWIGLARSLQTEIIGAVGALMLILVCWLVGRSLDAAPRLSPSRAFARGPTGLLHCWRSPSSAACCGMSLP